MSSERNIDIFSAVILVVSIIAIVMEAIGPFAGFYSGYYYYSCLDCAYYTIGDYVSQIFILILLIATIVIAINDLLPKKFISKDLTKFGLYFALLTVIFSIIGIISFGVTYGDYEWWPDLGFYGTIVGGVINSLLYFLKTKNK